MKIATTTEGLRCWPLSDAERVRLLAECGFRHIDFSLYIKPTRNWEYFADNWQQRALALRTFADELGVDYVQAHAPNCNPLDPAEAEISFAAIARALEVCALLGIPRIVYHAGWEKGLDRESSMKCNRAFVERLIPTLEKTGVMLCMENSTVRHMYGNYYFCDGESMRNFIEEINHPLFAACWDTGHANIDGDQYPHILALGKHLKTVHINDNFGDADHHLLPYMGTLNVDEVMHALIDVGFDGCFTLEEAATLSFHDNWLRPRHPFARDTRALNPSLAIARKQFELSYTVGAEILAAYQLPVE